MDKCKDCKNFNDGGIPILMGPSNEPPVRRKRKGYCSEHDAYTEPGYSFPCFKPESPKIRPCPVCKSGGGGLWVIVDNTLSGHCKQVQCRTCGTRGPHGNPEDWAIKRWNDEMLRKEGDE